MFFYLFIDIILIYFGLLIYLFLTISRMVNQSDSETDVDYGTDESRSSSTDTRQRPMTTKKPQPSTSTRDQNQTSERSNRRQPSNNVRVRHNFRQTQPSESSDNGLDRHNLRYNPASQRKPSRHHERIRSDAFFRPSSSRQRDYESPPRNVTPKKRPNAKKKQKKQKKRKQKTNGMCYCYLLFSSND